MAKNILVLGAGFGGLRVAYTLGKRLRKAGLDAEYHITLIDRNEYHTYTPILYEIATTPHTIADYPMLKGISTFPLVDIFHDLPVVLKKAEIDTLDLSEGDVHLTNGEKLPYDWVVIALGSEVNDFGIKGVKEHGMYLKSFRTATQLREKISWKIEGKKDSGQPVRIVVGGGGSTGIEIASEVIHWICNSQNKKHKCNAEVTLIDGQETLLAHFDPRVIAKVTAQLKKRGVKIILKEFIAEVTDTEIITKNGLRLPYDVFAWTGGVKAPSVLGKLPLKPMEQGRVEVVKAMKCLPNTPDLELYGMVYGLGDSVCFMNPSTGHGVPSVARAALSQATVVSYNIFEDIRKAEGWTKKARHKNFTPMNYPYIIPVGGKWAVAKLGPFVFDGFAGWILKELIELNYLLSIMSVRHAFRIWFQGLRVFIRNGRLG